MKLPIIKYVETDFGCALKVGSDRSLKNSIGSQNIHSIRNATNEDVAWVRAMGGIIPEGRIAKATGVKP